MPLCFGISNNMNYTQTFVWLIYQNLFTFIELESKHREKVEMLKLCRKSKTMLFKRKQKKLKLADVIS